MSAATYECIDWTEVSPSTPLRQGVRVELHQRNDGACTVVVVDNGTWSRAGMSYSPGGDRALAYLGGWTSKSHARRRYNNLIRPLAE